jgi:alpha-tubulin suppressor-like RCC1 family protein
MENSVFGDSMGIFGFTKQHQTPSFPPFFPAPLNWFRYGTLGVGHTTNTREPQVVLEDVEEVVGGGLHCIALKKDGSLWAWGQNNTKQIGIPDTSDFTVPNPIPKFWEDSERIVGIGCGNYFSWALTSAEKLYTWGTGEQDSSGPKLQNSFRASLPRARTALQWEKMFRWFSLGISDSSSAFGILPVDITFNAVSVWNKLY